MRLAGGGVALSTGGDCWAGVPGASSSLELPALVPSEVRAEADAEAEPEAAGCLSGAAPSP